MYATHYSNRSTSLQTSRNSNLDNIGKEVFLGALTPSSLGSFTFVPSESMNNFKQIKVDIRYSGYIIQEIISEPANTDGFKINYIMNWKNGSYWAGLVYWINDLGLGINVDQASDWGISINVNGISRIAG